MIRTLLLLITLLPLAASAQARPRVVVLKSADLAAYAALVAGFSSEVRADVEQHLLPRNPEDAAKLVARVKDSKPTMVLAVGPSAANAGVAGLGKIPLLFAMVPYYERYGLEGQNVVGIALTNDFTPEIAALTAAFPNARRVGVLHDPRYSGPQLEVLAAAAKERGVRIIPLPVDSGDGVDKALVGLTSRVDALVMVSDKTVGSSEVVRKLIQVADESSLPLVALGSTQVQEGALLALSPSYLGLGQQAGRLANRIIHEKVDPSALAVARPEALDLSLNLTRARRLTTKEHPVTEGLLTHAAMKGLTLRVYE